MNLFGEEVEALAIQDYNRRHQPKELQPLPWMESKRFIGVESLEQLKELIDICCKRPYVALDLETTGLDSRIFDGKTVDKIVGYCISPDGVDGYYVPVRHGGDYVGKNLPPMRVAAEIKRLCENTVIVVHNAGFDLEFLLGEGIEVDQAKAFEDTRILDYLRCSSEKEHGLKHLSKKFLGPKDAEGNHTGHEMFELKQLFPEADKKDLDFSKLDPFSLNTLRYACADAINTFLLYEYLKPVAVEQKMIYQIEKSCVGATRWMERNRAHIDTKVLARIASEIETLMLDYVNHIYEEVLPPMELIREQFYQDVQAKFIGQGKAHRFHDYQNLTFEEAVRRAYDVTSPKQLGDLMLLLFKHRASTGFDVELSFTGEDGAARRQVATANENIEAYVKTHGHLFPFLKRVNTYRTLQKVLGTYIRPLIENTNPKDSTTRFSFNGFTVDTGRFSASKGNVDAGYSGINVQSMPACYNTAKFPCRVVHARPEGVGVGSLHPALLDAITKRGFIRRIYDGHFMVDIPTGRELCVRDSCEGCPFASSCVRDKTKKVRVVSLESSARLGIVARDSDHILVASDESGVELRVAANASREPKWVEEFFRCATCGYSFDAEREKKVAPPTLCPSCESDKIGDLHTLTCQIVYGPDIVNAPDFKTYRQSSKCVVGSTRVLTDKGIVKLESLKPDVETSPDTFYPLSGVRVWTDEGIREVSHFYDGGVQPTIRMKTSTGFNLEGTKTHRVRVYDLKDGYVWRALGDMKEGDIVVLDRGLDDPTSFDMPQVNLPLSPFYDGDEVEETSPDNVAMQPFTLDWAYFCGLLIGDGNVSPSCVAFACDRREEDWIKSFMSRLSRMGLRHSLSLKNSGHGASIRVSSRRLSRTLKRWGIKDKSLNAQVPEAVWTSPRPIQAMFLRGLFDADGSVDAKGAVTLSSASKKLLTDVQVLLLSLGIVSALHIARADHPLTGRTYYRLAVVGSDTLKFRDVVGFDLARKNNRLRDDYENRFGIPNSDRLTTSKTRLRYNQTVKWNLLLDLPGPLPEDVMHLRARDVVFDTVVTLEDGGLQQVWDLTVPGPESFWANGFINHNSANFALLYGGGPSAVKAATGLSDDESRAFRDKFLAGLPTLNRWFKTTIDYARKHKEVSTLLGRKIRLPDIDNKEGFIRSKAERNAINSIIQGSATGDLTKYAMARIYNELKNQGPDALNDCRLILTVHDELVFDIKKSRLDEFIPMITGIMTELAKKMNWPVPLKCDVEMGPSWDVIYNWDGMHSPSAKTGLAHEEVPEELVHYIQHHPGMWVYDEEGQQKPLIGPVTVPTAPQDTAPQVVEAPPAGESETQIQHKWDSAVYTLDARMASPEALKKLMTHMEHFLIEKGYAGVNNEGVSVRLECRDERELWSSHNVMHDKHMFELLMQFMIHLNSFDPLRD